MKHVLKVKKATSFSDRLLGYLLAKNRPYLLLQTRFGIHTIFMNQDIDVLILDQNQKVVKIKNRLSPFRFFFYLPKYQNVLELPAGFIDKKRIKIADKIDLLYE